MQEWVDKVEEEAVAEGAYGTSKERYKGTAARTLVLPAGAVWRTVRVHHATCAPILPRMPTNDGPATLHASMNPSVTKLVQPSGVPAFVLISLCLSRRRQKRLLYMFMDRYGRAVYDWDSATGGEGGRRGRTMPAVESGRRGEENC